MAKSKQARERIPDHDHMIKGNGKGKVVVECNKGSRCIVQEKDQATINSGAKQDRAKGFRRAN